MKTYSPSQTKAFLTCEWLWKLEREGWRPNTYGKNTVYAIRGSAISAGIDAFHHGKDSAACFMATKDDVATSWDKERLNNREYTEFKSLPLTLAEVTDMACSVVHTYMEHKHLPYTVVSSEHIFANHGNARADIIGKNSSGVLMPFDLKTKDKPAQSYYEYLTKRDFAYDHQLMHYCWALSEETGVACLEYGIVILWYSAKPSIEVVPYSVTPERMELWLQSSKSTWAKMEAIENGLIEPSENAMHKSVFGPCPMYTACLEMNRDPIRMADSYFKILRS